MIMIKYISGAFLAVVLFLSSNATAGEKSKLDSPFKVLEYNTVTNNYGERATFILMNVRKKGDIGWIQVDLIHKTDSAQYMNGLDVIRIKEKHVDGYIKAVDKFLYWEKIASRDKDNFDKDIAQVNKIKFKFHSGSSNSHYLVMTFCALGTCVEPQFVFDKENATLLKKFFEDWKNDKLNYSLKNEIDSKYK